MDGEEIIKDKVYHFPASQFDPLNPFSDPVIHIVFSRVTDPWDRDTDGDGYNDKDDINPIDPYRNPVVFLHGWTGNSGVFGIRTNHNNKEEYYNNNFKSEYNNIGQLYSACSTQKIDFIEENSLSYYLTKKDYSANRNLFAFNYANEDMVQKNAERLSEYISNLIETAQTEQNSEYVDCDLFFATDADRISGNVQFDLIGYSMGGLVARYYTENVDRDGRVRKVIEIDVPNFGSSMADVSLGANLITTSFGKFNPGTLDLITHGKIFGNNGEQSIWTWRWDTDMVQYAIDNQSNKLNGNQNLDVKYYAIAGIEARFIHLDSGIGSGLFYKPSSIPNTTVYDIPLLQVTNDFENELDNQLGYYYSDNYEMSNVIPVFTFNDGVVDVESQLGLQFNSNGILQEKLNFEKQTLIIDNTSGHFFASPYHTDICNYDQCVRKIKEYLYD